MTLSGARSSGHLGVVRSFGEHKEWPWPYDLCSCSLMLLLLLPASSSSCIQFPILSYVRFCRTAKGREGSAY